MDSDLPQRIFYLPERLNNQINELTRSLHEFQGMFICSEIEGTEAYPEQHYHADALCVTGKDFRRLKVIDSFLESVSGYQVINWEIHPERFEDPNPFSKSEILVYEARLKEDPRFIGMSITPQIKGPSFVNIPGYGRVISEFGTINLEAQMALFGKGAVELHVIGNCQDSYDQTQMILEELDSRSKDLGFEDLTFKL